VIKNLSGQFLYFGVVSSLSGNAVTGVASDISGRRSIDGGGQAVIDGSISEVGGGQYRANLFAEDTNGNSVGYLFTTSGGVPVSFSIFTLGEASGRVHLAPNQEVNVNSGNLSGQQIELFSGNVVTVLSGSRVNTWNAGNIDTARSGNSSLLQLATTAPAQSGVLVGERLVLVGGAGEGQSRNITAYSGTGRWALVESDFVVDPDNTTIYSLQGNKTVPQSGNVHLAPNQLVNVNSGNLSGQVVTLVSGRSYIASGHDVVGTFSLASGALSGQQVTLVSGQSYVASGHSTVGTIYSGRLGINQFASGLITREIPERVLKIDMSGVTGEADRSPMNALRKLPRS
jgi:hypothetical protein